MILRRAELPRISFIVPVLNDAERLQVCLRSIRASAYPADSLEVLVVDNGSSDNSVEVAERCGAVVLSIPGVPVTELRNRAALASSGDILAYVDADNEIVPEWAASAVDTLRLPNVGATGAAYHAPPDGTWVQRAYGHLRGRPAGRKDVEWLGSGNLAVWRSVLDRVGGFDPSLDTCEDVDLCHRIRVTGLRVVSDERLRNVHHGDPATLWDLFKGELWRGRDNLRVSLRRPLSWRTVLTALIPMAEVAAIAAAVIALAIGGSGSLWLALATLMLLSVPASLKVARAVYREQHASGVGVAETFAVAWVYDMARALALVARMPHRGRSTTVQEY